MTKTLQMKRIQRISSSTTCKPAITREIFTDPNFWSCLCKLGFFLLFTIISFLCWDLTHRFLLFLGFLVFSQDVISYGPLGRFHQKLGCPLLIGELFGLFSSSVYNSPIKKGILTARSSIPASRNGYVLRQVLSAKRRRRSTGCLLSSWRRICCIPFLFVEFFSNLGLPHRLRGNEWLTEGVGTESLLVNHSIPRNLVSPPLRSGSFHR